MAHHSLVKIYPTSVVACEIGLGDECIIKYTPENVGYIGSKAVVVGLHEKTVDIKTVTELYEEVLIKNVNPMNLLFSGVFRAYQSRSDDGTPL